MKKCPKCSLNLEDSVMRCSYCGYDFAEEAEEAATEVINVEEATTPTPDEAHVEPTLEAPAPEQAQAPAQPVYTQYQQTPPPYGQQGYNPYGAPQHKFCPRCGNQCDPMAVICVKCGMPFGTAPQQFIDDTPSTGLKILCFFFPIVALILYLVEKDKKPNSAKAYGKMGIIGLIVGFVAYILLYIVIFALSFIFASSTSPYYDDYGYYYSIATQFLSMLK